MMVSSGAIHCFSKSVRDDSIVETTLSKREKRQDEKSRVSTKDSIAVRFATITTTTATAKQEKARIMRHGGEKETPRRKYGNVIMTSSANTCCVL